jgi:hypothetical protein
MRNRAGLPLPAPRWRLSEAHRIARRYRLRLAADLLGVGGGPTGLGLGLGVGSSAMGNVRGRLGFGLNPGWISRFRTAARVVVIQGSVCRFVY